MGERSSLWSLFRGKSKVESSSSPTEIRTMPTVINAVYYPNWRVYRSQPPSSLNLKFITHVFYAFARVRNDGTVFLTDEYADTGIDLCGIKGCLNDLRSIKDKHPKLKTILSLGGGSEGSASFPLVAGDRNIRSVFTQSAKKIVHTYDLDGIDIDWEHPSDASQGDDYVQMLTVLRNELPAPQYILTSALPAGEWALRHIDLHKASKNLDLINLMTYDFCGPWTSLSGHQSQLYTPPTPHNTAGTSCDSAVSYLIARGVASQKILLGIPTYGRSFVGATGVGHGYHSQGGEEGTYEFRYLPRPQSTVYYDNQASAVYCVNKDDGFVTYDDPITVRAKANYAKEKRLGGLFYWTGTGDRNDSQSLVEAGYRVLHPS